jgi:hypothetical protein
MDTLTPITYTAAMELTMTEWWIHMLAGGIAGRPPEPMKQERLQALISARRASATLKCKQIRVRSERGIARLVRENNH